MGPPQDVLVDVEQMCTQEPPGMPEFKLHFGRVLQNLYSTYKHILMGLILNQTLYSTHYGENGLLGKLLYLTFSDLTEYLMTFLSKS